MKKVSAGKGIKSNLETIHQVPPLSIDATTCLEQLSKERLVFLENVREQGRRDGRTTAQLVVKVLINLGVVFDIKFGTGPDKRDPPKIAEFCSLHSPHLTAPKL